MVEEEQTEEDLASGQSSFPVLPAKNKLLGASLVAWAKSINESQLSTDPEEDAPSDLTLTLPLEDFTAESGTWAKCVDESETDELNMEPVDVDVMIMESSSKDNTLPAASFDAWANSINISQ